MEEREVAIAQFVSEGLSEREATNAIEGFPLNHVFSSPCPCGHCRWS